MIHQDYWRAMGTWTTDAWRLNFVVRRGDTVLGAQELEGNDFLTLRTVDTASFLVPQARSLGIGKRMRRAEQLPGRDLAAPGVRAELWLALHPPGQSAP